ncbi:MAG: hypothetical protein ACE5KI_03060 [Dehalococcoidia bacterium]
MSPFFPLPDRVDEPFALVDWERAAPDFEAWGLEGELSPADADSSLEEGVVSSRLSCGVAVLPSGSAGASGAEAVLE